MDIPIVKVYKDIFSTQQKINQTPGVQDTIIYPVWWP